MWLSQIEVSPANIRAANSSDTYFYLPIQLLQLSIYRFGYKSGACLRGVHWLLHQEPLFACLWTREEAEVALSQHVVGLCCLGRGV